LHLRLSSCFASSSFFSLRPSIFFSFYAFASLLDASYFFRKAAFDSFAFASAASASAFRAASLYGTAAMPLPPKFVSFISYFTC